MEALEERRRGAVERSRRRVHVPTRRERRAPAAETWMVSDEADSVGVGLHQAATPSVEQLLLAAANTRSAFSMDDNVTCPRRSLDSHLWSLLTIRLNCRALVPVAWR